MTYAAAAAPAPVQPLAWELTYSSSVAIKKKKRKETHISVYVALTWIWSYSILQRAAAELIYTWKMKGMRTSKQKKNNCREREKKPGWKVKKDKNFQNTFLLSGFYIHSIKS